MAQTTDDNAREEAILGSSMSVNPAYLGKITGPAKMRTVDLSVYYGEKQAIKSVSLEVADRHVTALMGPSGCGKSTYLRALNRLHDLTPIARVTGSVLLDGEDINGSGVDVVQL